MTERQPSLHRIARAALATLGAAGAFGASAQQAPAAAPRIERVEITAQRRIEPLQEVAASVTAITSKQIEAAGIASTQDFVDRVPNMSFDSSFTYLNSFVQLRGVAQINNADSPVAIVIDGVPQNNQKQFKMSLVDVQRIEVLKGPQGALYGRNAIGGAVNIVTKAPTDRFEGFAGATYATGNDLTLNGGVSGALVPGVARYRVVAQTRRSDGTLDNTYLGRKVDGIDHDHLVRGKLSLTPGGDWSFDLQGGYNTFRAGAVRDGILLGKTAADIVAPDESMLGKTWGRIGDFSLKADHASTLGTFTSITAYTDLTENYRGDIDFTNATRFPAGFLGFLKFQGGQGQNLATRMTSQELRYTSPDDRPTRTIAGVYVLDTRRTLDTRFFVDRNGDIHQYDLATVGNEIWVPGFTPGDPAPAGRWRVGGAAESNANLATAVFGQVDHDFSKQLTLSAALRHDRDRRRQTDTAGAGGTRTQTFSNTQPKVTLTYKPGRDHVVYATYSTGFRSGGWNAPGLTDGKDRFKPEVLRNVEVGAKNTLLDGAMTVNVALFQADSKDYQYFYVDLTQGGAQIIGNLDKVRMRGLDLDARWRVTRQFELDAGVGCTDSIILASGYSRPAGATTGAAVASVVGNHTPKNTPLKVSLGGQFEWAAAGGQALARVDFEHRSKKYWQIDNRDIQPAVGLLSARLAWSAPGDRWNVALWGKNLTNEKYYADVNPAAFTGLPYGIGWQAPTRTVGVDAKIRF